MELHVDRGTDIKSTDLQSLLERLKQLTDRLEYLEQHHGDALTDFGQRLAAIEEKHGDALVALGSRLAHLESRTGQVDAPAQPQPAAKTHDFTLPPGTFLGHIPERYSSQLKRYEALGGIFGNEINTISYGYGDMVRFYGLCMAFDLIEKDKIKGEVVELGVYKGDTAVLLANFARKSARQLYLLDTFNGFDDRDLELNEQHLSGAFSETSLEFVKKRVGEENTSFVQGFFPDTAAHLPASGRYSLVHIDTDLYAPIKAGLEYFYPRLNDGGFLIMHDYMSLCWEGAIRAIDEFFADKPEHIIPIPDLAGTVMIRKIGR